MRISVVVPCYNGASYIGEALKSAVRQSLRAHEIIVVDDCSSDDSPEVIQQFPVRYVRMPQRMGPAAARNVGISAATGDIVAFLDADDVWLPNHCAVIARLLDEHLDADVAFTRAEAFGEVVGMSAGKFPADVPFDAFPSLLLDNYIVQSTAAVRRSTLKIVEGYRTDAEVAFAEDYDLWLRLALAAPFIGSPEVTGRSRSHGGQRSRQTSLLLRSGWAARISAWRTISDTAQADRYGRALHELWRRALRRAWIGSDEVVLDTLLAIPPPVPGAEVTRGRWARRRERLWRSWGVLTSGARLLPLGMPRIARRLIDILMP